MSNVTLSRAFAAGEDLTNDAYRGMVMTSTGTVRRPDSATERIIGVAQIGGASGLAIDVAMTGVCKMVAGGSIAIGDCIKIEYNDAADAGKGLATTTGSDLIIGRALSAAAEDELFDILLSGTVHSYT